MDGWMDAARRLRCCCAATALLLRCCCAAAALLLRCSCAPAPLPCWRCAPTVVLQSHGKPFLQGAILHPPHAPLPPYSHATRGRTGARAPVWPGTDVNTGVCEKADTPLSQCMQQIGENY